MLSENQSLLMTYIDFVAYATNICQFDFSPYERVFEKVVSALKERKEKMKEFDRNYEIRSLLNILIQLYFHEVKWVACNGLKLHVRPEGELSGEALIQYRTAQAWECYNELISKLNEE